MQVSDLSQQVERLTKEKDALKNDNLRLSHRISYLEEMRDDSADKTASLASVSDASRSEGAPFTTWLHLDQITLFRKPLSYRGCRNHFSLIADLY